MIRTLAIILLFLLTLPLTAAVQDSPYYQEIRNELPQPETDGEVLQLFQHMGFVHALTANSLYRFEGQSWRSILSGSHFNCALPIGENILVGAIGKILQVADESVIALPVSAHGDTVNALLQTSDGLLVGTSSGLYRYNKEWQRIAELGDRRINALLKEGDKIWAATNSGLFRRHKNNWLNLDEYIMAPGLRATYLSLHTYQKPGQVLFGGLFALGCIDEAGGHWLITGGDGLPYGPVTTIESMDETIWVGTPGGAAKKDGDDWHFYNGRRWLPGNKVHDILCIDPQTTWLATDRGISEIRQIQMTLEEKSATFEERIRLRHDRHGLVANSILTRPGDLSSNVTFTNDNDGLWTAIYLAAESFRYAVTKEESAYKNAVKAFEAMERLETITPISGFPARSFAKIDEDVGTHGEWHATADGEWKWKGDTSSDEIVGHMFAYPIFYDLVATGGYKKRCRQLVDRIMTHIVDHNFQLADLDGLPTRWGVWNPDSLNHRPDWWYERGINSLQILSFLKSAHHVTGREKYEKAYRYLISEHGYAENMVQQKMYGPFEINHSDDELAFLPYYALIRYAQDPELLKLYRRSLERSWKVEQPDRNPLWNLIASAGLGKELDLDIALHELQLIPMDMRAWRVENSFRWDVRISPLRDRFGNPQAVVPVPISERAVTKWNSNPYRLDQGGNGGSEDDGAYFLLPYWMGRYHGFIVKE